MSASQCHSFWLLLSEAMETNDERGWVESLLASGRGQDMAPKWLGRHCAGLL